MKAFAKGFVYAFRGVGLVSRGRNMRVHFCAAAVVVVFGLYFGITANQWTIIVLCIGSVIAAEAMNTAFEVLCDFVTTERVEAIRKVKDMAAGAVLVLAIASAVVAAIIFVPYF